MPRRGGLVPGRSQHTCSRPCPMAVLTGCFTHHLLRQQDHAADWLPVLRIAAGSSLVACLGRAGRSPFLPAPAVVAMGAGEAMRRRWCRRRVALLGQVPWRRHRPHLVARSRWFRVANRLAGRSLRSAAALRTAANARQCGHLVAARSPSAARQIVRSPWRATCVESRHPTSRLSPAHVR